MSILESIEDMAESWAQTLHDEGVQWQSVNVLYADARTNLRATGKTSFPPNVEDLIRAYDAYECRSYRGSQETHWQAHDRAVKGRAYPAEIPLVARLFRKREAAVVCRCKYSDGMEVAAKISMDGKVWECGNIGNPGCCDFVLGVDATLTAPLPTKSYWGAQKRIEEPATKYTPTAPPVEVTYTDEALLTSLSNRCEFSVPDDQREYWTGFARWLKNEVPVDVWSRKIASAMYAKWQKEVVTA